MRKNLEITKAYFSHKEFLLVINSGLQNTYSMVQKIAMKSWKSNTSFYQNILNEKKISKKIPVNKLKKLFDLNYHTKRINVIFKRCLK